MRQLQIFKGVKLVWNPQTQHFAHLILDSGDEGITIYLTLEEIINMGHTAEQWLEEEEGG